MRRLVTFLATGGYLGYLPLMPGTFGATLGLFLSWWLCAPLWTRSPAAFLMLFGVLFVAGCFIAGSAEQDFADHDAAQIVLDEVFGMIATMFLNPGGWLVLLGGFALFRAFDIIKPWPVSYFDRLHGGTGVMLDDLAAAIYANLVLQIVRRVV
ncbi:MAG TPA: phosphatidylglycerophosphatase A [Candidatus Binataceae bacterium]|nr:phosphatidylglycerophosphatase A [Candidatus Binataceae bacterium]